MVINGRMISSMEDGLLLTVLIMIIDFYFLLPDKLPIILMNFVKICVFLRR